MLKVGTGNGLFPAVGCHEDMVHYFFKKHMVLTNTCGRSRNGPHRQRHTSVLVRDHLAFLFFSLFTQPDRIYSYLVDAFKWSSVSNGI